jgi:hypothetical protein
MRQERAWIGYPSQTPSWEERPLGPGIEPRLLRSDTISWLLLRIAKETVVVVESTSHSTTQERRALFIITKSSLQSLLIPHENMWLSLSTLTINIVFRTTHQERAVPFFISKSLLSVRYTVAYYWYRV